MISAKPLEIRTAPVAKSSDKWAEDCLWEAYAIEAHLASGSVRSDINQRKTVRLLRRVATHLKNLKEEQNGSSNNATIRSSTNQDETSS